MGPWFAGETSSTCVGSFKQLAEDKQSTAAVPGQFAYVACLLYDTKVDHSVLVSGLTPVPPASDLLARHGEALR